MSPSATGRAPPGQKSFCKWTRIKADFFYDILPDPIKELADKPLAERQALDVESASPSQALPRPTRVDEIIKKDLPRVTFRTNKGVFTVELMEDQAPNTVANFVSLAQNGFYNGLEFVRKSSAEGNRGFIQGGSPDNTDMGGPGYTIRDEFHKNLKHKRGTISLAGIWDKKDSGGSQFFICMEDQPQFNGHCTVFGRVISGMEIVDQLEEGDKMKRVIVTKKRDHEYVPEKIEE